MIRLSRLLAVSLAAIGIGLVSGAVTQVAALDGSLKRAAAETAPEQPVPVSTPEAPPCRQQHPDRLTTTPAEPT